MGVKISALPEIVTPDLTDLFATVQGGVTYKESFTQLTSLFATAGANSNITSLSGLSTPLSITQGGTGLTAFGSGVATALGQNVSGTGNIALINAEVSWTPTITFATPGDLAVVYATQFGLYTQIGSLIFYRFFVNFTPTFTTASGSLRVAGIPVPCVTLTNLTCNGVATTGGAPAYPAGTTQLISTITSGISFFTITGQGTGVGATAFTASNYTTGAPVSVTGTGFYFA